MSPATKTFATVVVVPPPDASAATRIWYGPLTSMVGSKVASVPGGAPVPLARTTGVPRSRFSVVTFHRSIVRPAGGAMLALTGTGAVTFEPSAGVVPLTVGTGPGAAVIVIVTNAGADSTPRMSVAM